MESKYINRYNTFCKSLKNLEKSRTEDPKAIKIGRASCRERV